MIKTIKIILKKKQNKKQCDVTVGIYVTLLSIKEYFGNSIQLDVT